MQLYTTHLPAALAGQVLSNYFLANSKEYVSIPYPFSALPEWAANRAKKILNLDKKYYGLIGPDLVIIQQNAADDKDSLLIIWDKDDSCLYWNKNNLGWQREN